MDTQTGPTPLEQTRDVSSKAGLELLHPRRRNHASKRDAALTIFLYSNKLVIKSFHVDPLVSISTKQYSEKVALKLLFRKKKERLFQGLRWGNAPFRMQGKMASKPDQNLGDFLWEKRKQLVDLHKA